MKSLIILVLLLSFPVLGFAQSAKDKAPQKKNCIEAQVKGDDVKMYRQAGTSAEIVTSLKTTDEVLYHRKLNDHWAIVTVGDQVGYVLYSELTNRKAAATEPSIALQKKRK